ncbi:YycH family regulatory protein [Sporolactobacillus inulinus]|nr:two-component system activity regulator YycH [Sporolactobacillus inulinus]
MMQREIFKSILLGVLVLASVVMTSNILFYKSDFEKYKPNSTSQVAIAESRKFPQVIRPNLMLERNQNGRFGQNSNTDIQKVYSLLRQSVFSEITGSASSVEDADTPHYTLVFPAPLTFDALGRVFQFDSSKSVSANHIPVDRIDIFGSTDKHNVIAVFSSPDEKNKFYTTVDHLNFETLQGLYAKAELRPYDRLSLRDKVAYLPQGKTTMHAEVTYFERVSLEEFIPILFPDPDNVFAVRGKTEYTDSGRQLERTNNIVQYVNPGIVSSTEQNKDPILVSFDWMNQIKLWTNDFIYQGASLKNYRGDGTVSFRMTLGDYMVFNTDYPNWYLSMIELSWKSGELNSYKGTLLELNPVDTQGTIMLSSARDVLDQLKQANVPVNQIEDLCIGYELKSPSSGSGQSIMAVPDWFYKIGDRWNSVTKELIPSQMNNGKEDPS